MGSERRTCFETECVMALQGHPRSSIVIAFDPSRVFGDGGSIGPTSGCIKSKIAAVDDVIT